VRTDTGMSKKGLQKPGISPKSPADYGTDPLLQGTHRIPIARSRPKNPLPSLQHDRQLEGTGMNTRLNQIQNWSELIEQADWSAALLAEKCGASMRTLERHLHKIFGKCPRDWIAEQRRTKAIELFRHGYTVKETAAILSYKHAGNFSRRFPSLKSDALETTERRSRCCLSS